MPELFGDVVLGVGLKTRLGSHHPRAAAAVVTPASTTTASIGADLDADYEIGSISKGVTGLLYTDALERGEVGPDSTLGDLLPLGDSPVAQVTLASLATHRSGLPGLPRSAHPLKRTWGLWRHGTNPYGETLDQLMKQAQTVRLGSPKPKYSNFGFELLGHAVAAAASVPYADLVKARIAEPLGLEDFYIPTRPGDLRDGALPGVSRHGHRREPWTGEAIGPAGGIRSTVGDLATLALSLLNGTAPGVAALDPVAPFTRRSTLIGSAWITLEHKGREITWHSGGTGGFRAWLGVDREARTAVVLLSAVSRSVNATGFAMLSDYAAAARTT
jgi:CubicO group peptidase (beta-lactamase class C family)